MKPVISFMIALFSIMVTTVCSAAPTITTPGTSNIGANMATLVLTSSETGIGYFTLLPGSGANCGTGTQVASGLDSSGVTAPYHGSLPLTANAPGNHTVRNLTQSSNYTICFTADSPSGSNLNQVPAQGSLTASAMKLFTTPAWSLMGNGFSAGSAGYPSLAFAPDGIPYVAYQDVDNGAKLTVMKYTGGAWSLVGSAGFSGGDAYFISLAFAPDGVPYLAYSDYGQSGKATVKKFIAGAWVNVGTPASFSGAGADHTSLAFAPDGTPYVAYSDQNNTAKATVMKYTGGAWTAVGGAGFTSGPAIYTSLAFTPDGVPYLAFQDGFNSGKATVMRFSNSSWNVVGSAGFSAGPCEYTSLAMAPNGTPYLAYADSGNSGKATVMKFNGSSWTNVGTPGFSTLEVGFVSLAIAPDGVPHLAYGDYANSFRTTVMKNIGSNWSEVADAGLPAALTGTLSLSFAPDGTPNVACSDAVTGKATVMRLVNLPTISGFPATTATKGMDYSFIPLAANVDSFTITGGTLPPGLGLDSVTGVLSGKPTALGTYSNIIITASNAFDAASLSPFSITVFDTSPPETTLTGYPVNPTTGTSAIFTFTSPDSSASFECQLDGSSFDPCASGVSYSALAVGSHVFNVRAKNIAGNADPTPANYSWTINSLAPTIVKIGVKNYTTLAAALLEAISGDTLKILASMTPAGLDYSGSGAVTLAGGYDALWSRQADTFSPVSSLTIISGTLVLDQIVVK